MRTIESLKKKYKVWKKGSRCELMLALQMFISQFKIKKFMVTAKGHENECNNNKKKEKGIGLEYQDILDKK